VVLNLAPRRGVGRVVYGHGHGYAAYGDKPYTSRAEPVDEGGVELMAEGSRPAAAADPAPAKATSREKARR
jgi:hypothetical protein